jgi:hypothetical protein
MKRVFIVLIAMGLAFGGAASAQADILYGANGAGGNPNTHLFVLNPANGAVIQDVGLIQDAGANVYAITGLAFDFSTGVLYGSTGRQSPTAPGSLVTINRATAQATLVGSYGVYNQTAADLTIDGSTGNLYGWLEPSVDDLYRINKATGAATLVGDSGLSTYGSGLAANAAGTIFFAGDGPWDGAELRTIDKTTGAPTTVAFFSGAPLQEGSISALAFNSGGTLFGSNHDPWVENATHLVTIDPATGVITDLGATVYGLDAIAFVPLPSTLMLLGSGTGLMGLLGLRRRFRKS